jgi:hypothetical protein
MARIRSIKPEFPQSESIGRLSRDGRLLFIQLWTLVDDEGRARAASRMLASLLYPYDDDAPALIGGWLSELEDADLIRRYEVSGTTYLEIVNWLKHQKIDRPSASRIPPFSTALAKPRTLEKDQKDMRACALESDWPKDFREQFWNAFPRKSGKAAAIRKLETIRRGGQVPWERLLAAVGAYSAHVAGKDPQFTKMPQTWLNGGCWDDELPSTMATVPSAQMVVAGFTWVHAEDHNWRPLAERFRREKGHGPPKDRDMGWRFPDAWLTELEHENAA